MEVQGLLVMLFNSLEIILIFSVVEEFGEKYKADVIPASMDQIASICYTSVRAIFFFD